MPSHEVGSPESPWGCLGDRNARASQDPRGEVLVRLRSAALNRRDYWITQGLYPDIHLPVTLGSDGAGVVCEIGEGVQTHWLNREVMLYPGLSWGETPKVQSDDFQVLGMPRDGTLSTHVLVPEPCLYPKPSQWSFEQAAALLSPA